MDIYIRFDRALKLIRYDEESDVEDLVDAWITCVSNDVIPAPEIILAIYYRLCQGNFGMEHYPSGQDDDGPSMIIVRNIEQQIVIGVPRRKPEEEG